MATQDQSNYSLKRQTGSPRGSTSTYSRSGSGSGTRLRVDETGFNQVHEQEAILTESNLKSVLNALSEARNKWYDIGIQVDVSIRTLNDIKEKCSTSGSASSDSLRDMLVFCSTQRRTRLVDFIEALRSPAIDLQVCAKTLEDLVEKLHVDGLQMSSNASVVSANGSGDNQQRQNLIVRRLTIEAAKQAKCSHHFEIIIVGDTKVGKTSMLKKFLRTGLEVKDDVIRSTVTPDPLGYRVFKYRDKYVKLNLWDMPGSCSCFSVVNERILESADGAIMLFDVTNKQSFVNLVSDEDNSRRIKRSWMKELKFKAKGDKYPVMILVGNKIDCTKRKVSESVIKQLLPSQSNMPYFEISAKENIGIEEVFTSFVVLLMKKAATDKRYGKPVRSDESSNHNDHSQHDEKTTSDTGHKHTVAQTYPPGTAVRNQPTSHPSKERVTNSNLTPQSEKLNSCFCC